MALPRELANRYTVRTPIGEGAFSVTYLAVDNSLQRDVAIKVLREQYAAHKGFDTRFEREARAAGRISHPNVISVYDYGRHGGVPYIVMQYVDGPNLKEYVREEGPLTVEESINFARQILDGLAVIHDTGIIHRDVKPQNVLIDDGLQAKITDFGVAFITVDPGLTETGMAVGTAAYMAPEQASGEMVGPQSDLYAVGVILYELLTGRLPFPGENPVQVMYRHVNEMPNPPRALNRSVPLAVEAVVLKALAKDPQDRYPDARTMREALINPGSAMAETRATPVVHAHVPAPGPRVERRRPAPAPVARSSSWPVALLLLLVIGLIVVLVLLLMSDRFGGFTAGADPTATSEVAVVAPEPTATATEEPEEAVQPEPTSPPELDPTATLPPPSPTPEEPTPTPEPSPTPTEEPPDPSPTPEPEEPEEDDAGGQFNTPFDGRFVPVQWTNGRSMSLDAEQFLGGGASEPDEGDFPGAVVTNRVDIEFAALADPSMYVGITMAAMRVDDSGAAPMRLTLNGNEVWSGPAPFLAGEWTEIGWTLGNLGWLHEGVNILSVEVLSTGDALLVSNATVYYG